MGTFNAIGPTVAPRHCRLRLLHPIFGEFVDNTENYVPTPNDVQFLFAFVEAITNIYKVDNGWQKTLLGMITIRYI